LIGGAYDVINKKERKKERKKPTTSKQQPTNLSASAIYEELQSHSLYCQCVSPMGFRS